MAYAISQIKNVINHTNSTISTSTVHIDVGKDKTIHKPYDDGFQFAITFIDENHQSVELDEQIVTLSIRQEYFNLTTNNNLVIKSTDVSTHVWSNEILGVEDFTGPGKIYSTMYCPNMTDFKLKGDLISSELYNISVSLLKWTQNCKPESDIITFLNSTSITMLLLEHYVDFDDISNPVKYKMNNRNGYYTAYDSLKFVNIFL